jgi:hypothetical protein
MELRDIDLQDCVHKNRNVLFCTKQGQETLRAENQFPTPAL